MVVSGKFEFQPLPDQADPESIHLFADVFKLNSGSGGAGNASFKDLLRWLGTFTYLRFVDESRHSELEKRSLTFHPLGALRKRDGDPEERARLLELLLQNLSKQTSLRFRIERREVEKWFVTPGSARKPISFAVPAAPRIDEKA